MRFSAYFQITQNSFALFSNDTRFGRPIDDFVHDNRKDFQQVVTSVFEAFRTFDVRNYACNATKN